MFTNKNQILFLCVQKQFSDIYIERSLYEYTCIYYNTLTSVKLLGVSLTFILMKDSEKKPWR